MFFIKFTLSFIFHCATAHLHKLVKTTLLLINKKHYDVVSLTNAVRNDITGCPDSFVTLPVRCSFSVQLTSAMASYGAEFTATKLVALFSATFRPVRFITL